MNTTNVEDNEITIIPCPNKPKITATITPAIADIELEVDLNTSGINIDVKTAKGI